MASYPAELSELRRLVALRLSPARYRHTEGVLDAAQALAGRYGADVRRAEVAALVHDLERERPAGELLRLAEGFGFPVHAVERDRPMLLHGPVAARTAPAELGVTDPEVLRAVAVHTTGAAPMSLLDQVIYLADYIEPGRDFPGVAELRRLAEQDLRRACLAATEATLRYVLTRRELIHPRTVEARNWLLSGLGEPGGTRLAELE